MRRAVKFQVLVLIALLALVTMSSGILGAFGDESGPPEVPTQPPLTEQAEPAEEAPVEESPAEEPADAEGVEQEAVEEEVVEDPVDPPLEQAARAEASEEAPAEDEQAPELTPVAPSALTEPGPEPAEVACPCIGVVEALIWEDTNANGIADESPLVLLDGITVNLYRQEDGGAWTFLGSKVSGPGAYGPFGIYQPPPFGYAQGWVGWNELPTGHGDKDYVDYVLEMVPPPGYYATGAGTVRIGRVWAQSLEHPFCWWRFFYLDAANPGERAFSLARKSVINGYKFADMNENGKMDDGEAGIPGVTIVLDGGAESMATGQDGFFSFEVVPGSHTVEVDESTAPGYYPTTPTSAEVEVGPGEEKGVNFGNAPFGSISGHKWEDKDRSGSYDEGEPPVGGVTVKLTGTTTTGEPVAMETVTADDGTYSFTGLKGGSYTVTEIVPADWTSTAETSIDVSLTPGQNVTDVDFFNARNKGTIRGYKFEDMDESGTMDPGEAGLEGVSIILDGGAQSAVTDVDGFFSFEVEPGEHAVEVDESTAPGYYPTTPISVEVEVGAGAEETLYFGNAPFGSISGRKWDDENRNSRPDTGELPVAGVTIQLTGITSLEEEPVVMETTTGIDGSYVFEGLKAGDYTVSEVVPVDMEPISDELVDVSIVAGESLNDVDFFNAMKGGTPEPPVPPVPPVTPDPATPQPSSPQPTSTVGTTLPRTGMNQLPFAAAAGLAMLAGLALMAAGVTRRRGIPAAAAEALPQVRSWE